MAGGRRTSRAGRDNAGDGTNSRGAWWNRGHIISADDEELAHGNMGLNARERRALAAENSRPWGQSMFARSAVTDRAKDARAQAKAKREAKAAKAAKRGAAKQRGKK
jgi:hypothetical protein